MARSSFQEGSVYENPNGKWWKGRYRVWEIGCDGKRRRVQKNVILGPMRGPDRITKAQAKSRLVQKVRAVNEGRHKPSFPMPWAKTEAEAKTRAQLLAETAKLLRSASVPTQTGRKLLEQIAAAASERTLRAAGRGLPCCRRFGTRETRRRRLCGKGFHLSGDE